MYLRDYIGDTRTESLPAGFLKSIKIKYRHEASNNVFPRAPPVSRESENAGEQNVATSGENVELKDEEKRSEGKEDKVLPNFMSWRVPPRLLNQRQATSQNSSGKNVKEKINGGFKATGNLTSISRQSTSLTCSVRSIKSSSSKGNNKSDLRVKENSLVPKSACSKLGSRGGNKFEENVKSHNSKHINEGKDDIEEISGAVPKLSSSQHSNEGKEEEKDKEEEKEEEKDKGEEKEEGKEKHEGEENDDCQLLSSKNNDKNEVQESVRVLISRSSKQSIKSGQNMNQYGRIITSGRLKRSKHKMKEVPKLDISSHKGSLNYQQVEDKSGLLPRLKSTKERMSANSQTQRQNKTLTKLPSSPERVDNIYTWVRKSTSRERQAAFNLLSTFIASEKIQSSKPQKERIKIALQALERKKTPIKPLRVNELVQNLTVLNVNHQTLKNRNQGGIYQPTNSEKQELKTWHHLPVYHYASADNRGALFVQPWRSYEKHFSIHPAWGLHKQENMANC